jgi:predicted O-methyltransferase YrrM
MEENLPPRCLVPIRARVRQRVERSISARLTQATSRLNFAAAVADVRLAGAADLAAIRTHMTTRELVALYTSARAVVPAARALEIGSYLGASSVTLAAGLRHRGGSLICVDTWQNETMDEPHCRPRERR